MARRALSSELHEDGALGSDAARSRARSMRPVSRYARKSRTARVGSLRSRPDRMLSIHVARNGASSAEARRSSSCEHAAIDMPSDPGSAAGASDRRDSGKVPEPGGVGEDWRGGGTDAGGGALWRTPRDPRVVVLAASAGPERDGADSVAKDGGGTKARRAIEPHYSSAEWPLRLLAVANCLAGRVGGGFGFSVSSLVG